MDFIRCECGCEIFYQVSTMKVNRDGFIVYNGSGIKADIETASLLICLQCNRAILPTITWPGKNRMDPEVQAHQEVYDAVQNRNHRV